MVKVFRFLIICTISVAFTSSIARAQTYKQVDYPGAIFTEISGGPNLEGTSVGLWEDSGGVFHGFSVTAKGVFTSFDPPGSTFTQPNFINLQGVIVGAYLDSSFVSHGFILNGKNTQLLTSKVRPAPLSVVSTPRVKYPDSTCSDSACGNTGLSTFNQSFVRSTERQVHILQSTGRNQQREQHCELGWCSRRCLHGQRWKYMFRRVSRIPAVPGKVHHDQLSGRYVYLCWRR